MNPSNSGFTASPRLLITGERFRGLSTDAKLLYGLMLDRMELSTRNGWYDSLGRVYIYFTLEQIEEALSYDHNKAVKLIAELDRGSGIGLIEQRKQGQGKQTIIYDASSGLYKVVLTDTNNAINSDFPYQNGNGLTFSKSGNKLTVTATPAALNNTPVTVTTKGKVLDTENASPVIWGTSNSNHDVGQILSQMAKPDPVPCYFKLQPGTTSLEIEKQSDDGNVAGITFTIKDSAGAVLYIAADAAPDTAQIILDAYCMKLEALSHQGKACGQVGHKSRDDVSDTDSGRQIQRYIHLT